MFRRLAQLSTQQQLLLRSIYSSSGSSSANLGWNAGPIAVGTRSYIHSITSVTPVSTRSSALYLSALSRSMSISSSQAGVSPARSSWLFATIKNASKRSPWGTWSLCWFSKRQNQQTASMSTEADISHAHRESDNYKKAVFEVNQDSFADVVLKSDIPVIVNIYADWCGPCRKFTPRLEESVMPHVGKLKLAKINIDASPQIAASLGVKTIPAVFWFWKGQKQGGFVGRIPQEELDQFIANALKTGAGK